MTEIHARKRLLQLIKAAWKRIIGDKQFYEVMNVSNMDDFLLAERLVDLLLSKRFAWARNKFFHKIIDELVSKEMGLRTLVALATYPWPKIEGRDSRFRKIKSAVKAEVERELSKP